jgi:hypothetical protein
MCRLLFITLTFCLALQTVNAQNQKSFTGTIKYVLANDKSANVDEELNFEMIYISSYPHLKIEVKTQEISQVVIQNIETRQSITYIEGTGQKNAISITETKDEQTSRLQHTRFNFIANQTKVINGIECKAAELFVPGETEPIKVFFTEKYQSINPQFAALPGLALEYEMNFNGTLTRIVADEITEHKVKPVAFEIPEGYQVYEQ